MKFPLVMTLPYPISANAYWATRIIPAGPGRKAMASIYATSEAKAFKEDIGWRVKAYGVTAPHKGRLCIGIRLFPARPQDWQKRMRADPLGWDNTVRCLDVDNARKVLYDAFKDVLYVDDKQIFRDAAERMEPDGREACVVVTVTEYQREANPQLAFGELLA